MFFISHIFKKNKVKPEFKFQEVNFIEFQQTEPDALYKLFKSEINGFLIRGFLNENELGSILENYHCMQQKDVAKMKVGYTYPIVFAEISSQCSSMNENEKKRRMEEYFFKNESYPDEFKKDFGFDLKNKINVFFESISGNRIVEVPRGYNNIGSYPFGNFRYLIPEMGKMTIHCGNLFQVKFEKFYEHLTKTVKVVDQMSYFIMISEPEGGGELDVFNFRWEDGQKIIDDVENEEIIIKPNGKKVNPNNPNEVKKLIIKPKPGDMILFQGGSIWHRVNKVKGDKPRITFGGFIGMDKSENKFYYWA